jgi:hypothetical protein
MNPECPVCGDVLALEPIADVMLDYSPAPPAAMREYFSRHGSQARVWECFGCGQFWAPAA